MSAVGVCPAGARTGSHGAVAPSVDTRSLGDVSPRVRFSWGGE
jgi:hypothetical protein